MFTPSDNSNKTKTESVQERAKEGARGGREGRRKEGTEGGRGEEWGAIEVGTSARPVVSEMIFLGIKAEVRFKSKI